MHAVFASTCASNILRYEKEFFQQKPFMCRNYGFISDCSEEVKAIPKKRKGSRTTARKAGMFTPDVKAYKIIKEKKEL